MNKFVSYYRSEGCFNLCDWKEKSAQYIFDFGIYSDLAKEYGVQKSYLVNIEDDCFYNMKDESPEDLAYWLKDYYSGFIFNSNVSKVNQLLKFLEEIQEENNIEYYKHMIEKTKQELEKTKQELEKWENKLKRVELRLRTERPKS